jgi:hypothetical protein
MAVKSDSSGVCAIFARAHEKVLLYCLSTETSASSNPALIPHGHIGTGGVRHESSPPWYAYKKSHVSVAFSNVKEMKACLAPVRVLFADFTDLLAFWALREFQKTTLEIIRGFIPHTGTKRLGLGLASYRAAFLATVIVLVGADDTTLILNVAGRHGIVIRLSAYARCAKEKQRCKGKRKSFHDFSGP